jgi:hypothetical protein
MFKTTFWALSKPVNSTAIPSGTGAEYDCQANQPLSVSAPVIKLQLPASVDPTIWNYCYIPNLHRYYWVSDWVYQGGLWFASMAVDALASYKTQIGALSPYILRAAAAYNGQIQDNLYPAKAVYQETRVTAASPWEYGTVVSGCYSVGIVSAGGVTDFWVMSRATLSAMLNYLLSEDYAADVLSELAIDAYPEAKAIIEPLQYISSVTWLPVPLPETTLTAVKIGYAVFPMQVSYANPSRPSEYPLSFNRPTHPQAAARGVYMNAAPYTRYSLFVPPFGKVEIDGSLVLSNSAITATIYLDRCLGNGTMEIKSGNYVISRVNARIGMPVQLSQVIAPGMGILSVAGAAAGIAGSLFNKDYAGAISGGVSAIGDAIKSQIPSVNTIGSVGSCDALIGVPALQAVFAMTVDDDITSRGRPLCEVRRIDTLPGYLMCADVEVNIGCTASEHAQIKSYMESGFYYA